MNASWKGCDALARSSVFDDLTEEGLRHYQIQLSEYLEGADGGGEEAVVVSQQLHRMGRWHQMTCSSGWRKRRSRPPPH